jgi:hypothetical protein
MRLHKTMSVAVDRPMRRGPERALSLLRAGLAGMALVLFVGTGTEAGHPDRQAAPLLMDGEKLEFEVFYGMVPAGRATLEVRNDSTAQGDVYRIVSKARSNAAISLFFKVDDTVVIELDAKTSRPLLFEKHLREGPFKRDERSVYEPGGLVKTGGSEYQVEPGARDILSSLYYVRGLDLHVGEVVTFRAFEGGKDYDARVRVLGREKVKTGQGDYNCLVIEPEIKEGIFSREGGIKIWLTDDALKIPVLMKSKVAIGSFIARLVRVTHGEGV